MKPRRAALLLATKLILAAAALTVAAGAGAAGHATYARWNTSICIKWDNTATWGHRPDPGDPACQASAMPSDVYARIAADK